jgi:manganese/zinc/iron transport system permease protein
MFSFSFPLYTDEIQFLALVMVSVASAITGSFLVLRKMSMLANALSHTILLGIVLSFLILKAFNPLLTTFSLSMESMFLASLLTGVLTNFITDFLHKTFKLQEDASIGLVFTTLFAIGIILVTLFTKNSHIGTEVVMGNVDALQENDLNLIFYILLINIAITFLCFKEYKITTFDSALAFSMGLSPIFFSYLLMVQVSLTVIGAFRAVGVLMVLTFLVGPCLIAKLFVHSLLKMILLSCFIGSMSSILGVAISRHILSIWDTPLSTGGIVVTLIGLIYLIAIFIKILKNFYQNYKKKPLKPLEL